MMGRTILLILDIIAFILFVLWYINTKEYEPLIGVVLSISGFIGLYLTKKKGKSNKSKQMLTQKGGANSTNYQSGGDMKINNK